ncbi:uncharacterized protein LOC114959410 [Acropora millepora]|uniref:uncharacterized protein LOC114959410 n=1 Tax=Acropora millepora TaxID=45264 RepID=UPI001CF0DC19|nr:uncharacterized protein LOC114959410 [Acropora millepora]XP_044163872.1 uncharacterized protein LOC114959410 [Acropora millepora]XP_044163877.1 uncharacterized protein LOC114959410 [Acropora millepora]XP_044163881.1 uncharacterized protein LOC114959410 [Acropora millepora]
MYCDLCQTRKLRREFPSDTITDKCEHAPLHCLRCLTKHVQQFHKCSQCSECVNTGNPRYLQCLATLENLFPKFTASPSAAKGVDPSTDSFTGNQTISVVMLGGDSTVLAYEPLMAIGDLKLFVQKQLGPVPEKQRILYKEQELKTNLDSGKCATLRDYAVKPFSTLHLVVVLYEINNDSLDNVIFDLFWGYPVSGRDYLDASVLLYKRHWFRSVVDYEQTVCKGVSHSGDVMDDAKRRGHHTISVKLKSLPAAVDKLFFTLSAYNSPNISKFKNPSLRFFDAREPNKQLCSDHMQHAAYSEAIIMCSLCKINGVWKVFSLRKCSAGNAENYTPLKKTIGSIIAQGLC